MSQSAKMCRVPVPQYFRNCIFKHRYMAIE